MGLQNRVQVFMLLFGVVIFNTLVFAGQNNNDQNQQEEKVNIWQVRRDVHSELFNNRKDLVQWAIDVQDSKPKTAKEAIIKIDVLMRAGLDEEACQAVDEFHKYTSENQLNNLHPVISYLYSKAYDEYKAWSVAVRIAEDFAPHIHSIPIRYLILEYHNALQLPGDKPWNFDQTIAWLDARVESVRRYDQAEKLKAEAKAKADLAKKANAASPNAPAVNVYFAAGRPWRTQPIDFWCDERLKTLDRIGRGGEGLARLAREVRENPDDTKLMRRYVLASPMVRGSKSKNLITEDVKWLADVARLDYATDLWYIGKTLMRIKQPAIAESFFRLAIDKEITDADVRRMTRMTRMMMTMMPVTDKTLRLLFEVDLLEGLSKSLVAQNKNNDEAQKLMVKAADIREGNNLGTNTYLAGQVQAVSFARVIEGRILDKEKKKENRNDPQYWYDRANYYCGRKEADKQEHALRKGLTLTEPASRPHGKHSGTMRLRLLWSLLQFLQDQKREIDMLHLVLEEMKNAPIDSESTKIAARFLERIPKQIDPDEKIIWDWFSKCPVWDHPADMLLYKMFRVIPLGRRDEFLTRAEKIAMAPDAHPSRAKVLGWVITQMDEYERSIPILQFAIKSAEALSEKDGNALGPRLARDNSTNCNMIIEKSSLMLFDSYRALRQWRNAEKVFVAASGRLTPKERYEWFGRLAFLAAKDNENAEAMRIFRRVINCNFRNQTLISLMVEVGLGKEVQMFFDEVQKKLPAAKLLTE